MATQQKVELDPSKVITKQHQAGDAAEKEIKKEDVKSQSKTGAIAQGTDSHASGYQHQMHVTVTKNDNKNNNNNNQGQQQQKNFGSTEKNADNPKAHPYSVYKNQLANIVAVHKSRKTNAMIPANPYDWPHDGGMDLESVALICIDWQSDFVKKGGYIDSMGIDLTNVQKGIAPTAKLLKLFRELDLKIVHTREGYRPDMTDCSTFRLWRSQKDGVGIGSEGPMGRILIRGEPGWEIVPELAPDLTRKGRETVIDKPSKGAFGTTEIDLVLSNMGVKYLIFTGVTTDVCVHTIIREACDKGYDTLLLTDCTGATESANEAAAKNMIAMQGGIFGALSDSETVLGVFEMIKKTLENC